MSSTADRDYPLIEFFVVQTVVLGKFASRADQGSVKDDGFGESTTLEPDQRRALLAHLLAAEGLPGVEEIEGLREQAAWAAKFEGLSESQDATIASLRSELAATEKVLAELVEESLRAEDVMRGALGIVYEPEANPEEIFSVSADPEELTFPDMESAVVRAAHCLKSDLSESRAETERERIWFQEKIHQSATDLRETRQARLHELLEAEARERVERSELSEEDPIEEDSLSTLVTFSTDNGSIDLDVYGNATKFECEPLTITVPEADLNAEEAWDLILCLAAALAEKRRREEQSALESIPEEAWEEQYADMRRFEDREDPAVVSAFVDQLRNAPSSSDDNLSDLVESEASDD